MPAPYRLKRILEIIHGYDGSLPLHHFLKNYFRMHREMGSSDRRIAAGSVYSFFRLGHALQGMEAEKRLAVAVFLTANEANDFNVQLIGSQSPLPVNAIGTALDERIRAVKEHYAGFSVDDLFPFDDLSRGCDKQSLCRSMLVQPAAWLRLKKGFEDKVVDKLNASGISFHREENRLMLEAGTDAAKAGVDAEWYEVQDRSSQLTGGLFLPESNEEWFDCCAASGGKSLLLHSINPEVRLTVCDRRQASLNNLHVRFARNKVQSYRVFAADLTAAVPPELKERQFDGIIADVPCSGSGTWSRTPEQVTFYKSDELKKFNDLQWNIVKNIAVLLKPGKPLIYITCSVFSSENEIMTERICNQLRFIQEKSELFTGYQHRADTLFAARLIKK